MAKENTIKVRLLVEVLRATLGPLGVTGDLDSLTVVRDDFYRTKLRVKTSDGAHRHEYNFDTTDD